MKTTKVNKKNNKKNNNKNNNKKRYTKKYVNQKGGTEITEADIILFLQLVSKQRLYTSDFDKLCREESILLKFFKKTSDCDILFLNLLSKRKIVDEIIKVTTDLDAFNKVTVDEVTHFIENNDCTMSSNFNFKNITNIKTTVKTIVNNVFNKGFSLKAITPMVKITPTDTDTDKKEFKSELLNLLSENESSYNFLINEMLEIYFGISDKKDPELCLLVNVIFNLSRLVGLLSIHDMKSIVKKISNEAVLDTLKQNLKLDRLSDSNMNLLISKTNELLMGQLDIFCLKYFHIDKKNLLLEHGQTQIGGGSIWSGFKQLFIRPLAAGLWIALTAFHTVISFGAKVISFVVNAFTLGNIDLWNRVYVPYFFNTFYKKVVRSVGRIATDTWDETIIYNHFKILPDLFNKYGVKINNDIIEEYKTLIPFLVKLFPISKYESSTHIEIPGNIQKMLKRVCFIENYDQQLDYLYYRRRNFVSLLSKYLKEKLNILDDNQIQQILKKYFFFDPSYLEYFIDYNLSPQDYFALDCRNLKHVRKVKSKYHSMYNNYKKKIFTKEKAGLIIFTNNKNIEQSSLQNNMIHRVNPIFQNGNNEQPRQNGNIQQPRQNGNIQQPIQNGNIQQPRQNGNIEQPRHNNLQNNINIDEEFRDSNLPEYRPITPLYKNYRNKPPQYENPPKYRNTAEVPSYYHEEHKIYKWLMIKKNLDQFLLIQPNIRNDNDNDIRQFTYNYSNIKEGLDMLLDYLILRQSSIAVYRERFKEFIDDPSNISYKQELTEIIMSGIYKSFKVASEICYLWLTGKKLEIQRHTTILSKLFINSWNLNLISCEDIECLQQKNIFVNLNTNKKNENRFLEITNNGVKFPFDSNDHEEHTYSELSDFFNETYSKNHTHMIGLYQVSNDAKFVLEELSKNINYKLTFRNNENGESVIKLERITPLLTTLD